MKGIMRKLIYLGTTAALAMSASLVSAVPVHINSGNPAYPFPQFLEYACGGNLGTKNAEGVVHAEMEQDIRDAYQIHANEFEYTGEAYKGIKYIQTPDKQAYDCTEGDGYGLMAAAYMADIVTFNGYWMCTHDKRRNRTKSYKDCSGSAEDYGYGPFALSDGAEPGHNTAADGDVDVAIALYVAYKQWGEFMHDENGNDILDACGNKISYKQEMINVIRGLVALSTRFPTENPMRVNSGIIGLDGYPKGGDTWVEQTSWAGAEANRFTFDKPFEIFALPGQTMVDINGITILPEFAGSTNQHIDYNAPAYFREFYDLFHELASEVGATYEWEAEQFRRAEASSDWLVEQLTQKNEHTVLEAGWCSCNEDGTETKFWNMNDGEDWRCPMRQILNYVWHGNPEYTWDPKTHKVVEGGNTYEYNAGVRLNEFFKDPASWNPAEGSACITYPAGALPYGGPNSIYWIYDPMTGVLPGDSGGFVLNRVPGGGASAPVAAQDYEVMGQIYRTCDVVWDNKTDAPAGAPYTAGTPKYMHGWARHYGMMVLTGNFPAPGDMKPSANMKIYRAIKDSVTFAYTGDTLMYLLDYRNYGSVDAEGVVIVENVPKDFVVKNIYGGGVYNPSNRTITWAIGNVSGYHSDGTEEGCAMNWEKDNLKATVGQVGYSVTIGPEASGRYCTTAEISCTNGTGWVTNEYPNYITATMQRNCVDVYMRALMIEKSVDRPKINPDNIATFAIDFENSSKIGWVDGGRPRVNVSYALYPGREGVTDFSSLSEMNLQFRLYNDAIEPYINYGNYRISYYLYDPSISCLGGTEGCDTGWGIAINNIQGGDESTIELSHENIVEGEDPITHKRYNQRLSIRFPQCLISYYTHVNRYKSNLYIHKGGITPFRGVWRMFNTSYTNIDWTDDWSFDEKYIAPQQSEYFPITPSFQRLDENGKSIEEPIDRWLTCGCTTSSITVPNILVEEYDGYVWRRVLGSGPMPGIEFDTVVIRDTLPKGMEFVSFVGDCPLGNDVDDFGATWRNYKAPNGQDIVEWTIPKIQVNQKGTIKYMAKITFPSGNECQTDDETIINKAWISAVKCSPIGDTAKIIVTCAKVPDPVIPTTLTKVADKSSYSDGDDITYTIGYKQTHGAIFDDAAKETSNWTLTDATISGGEVTVGKDHIAKHNKSYALNSYIEMTCNVNYYESCVLYLRDNIKINIRQEHSTLDFVVTDGSLSKDFHILHSAGQFKLKILLNGDILNAWVNGDTSKRAPVTVEGLSTLTAGYFSISALGGSHKFSNIHIHTDYAYDLSIIDQVPSNIVVDEGSFESYHNDVPAGTGKFLKGDDGDSIVWTGLAENPIAFGDTFTVIWKGKVDGCVGTIINYAYAHLFGHKDGSIADYVESKCNNDDCEGVQRAELTFKDGETVNTICDGDSAVLVAVGIGTPASSSNYKYEFFLGSTSLGEASYVDTLVVKKAGDYKVKISDPECPLASDKPSTSVTLKVNDLPNAEIEDEAVLCSDETLDLTKFTVDDHSVAWYEDINEAIPVEAEEIPAERVRNKYFYVLTDNVTSCKGKVKEFEVTINDVPASPIVEAKQELPLKEGATKDIKSMAKPSVEGNSVVWYKTEEDALNNTNALTTPRVDVDLSVAGPQEFFVREKSAAGCMSLPVPVSVVVTESQKPNFNDTTICVGEEIEVASLVTIEEGASLVWYDSEGNTISDPGTYSSSESGTKEFYVAQKKGETISEKITFTITAVEVAKLKEDISVSYCSGEAASELKAEIDAAACPTCKTPTSYNWYQEEAKITNLIPNTNVQEPSTIYYYEVEPVYDISENHSCVGSKVDYSVTVMFVPTAKPARPIMYTLSDAVGGVFPSLIDKDPSAIVPSDARSTLEWYTADGVLIDDGTVPPSPTMDMVDSNSEVTTITYKVKQVKNGCKSEFEDVTVIITKTPTPKPENAYFCEGETPDAIENYVTFDPGFDPVWYDGDPLKGGMEVSTALTINTAADPGEVETVREYFVAQRNSDGISAALPIKVTVYTKPKIKAYSAKSCVEPVSTLDLWEPISKKVEDTHFYIADSETFGYKIISTTSSFTVAGYFSYTNKGVIKECLSERSRVHIEIHDLGTVSIEPEGDYAICPNSAAELNVSITGENLEGSTLTYSWNKNNNAIEDGKFLSDPITEATTFSVTLSDGVCTQTFDKKVGVTPGKIEGVINMSEAGSDKPAVVEIASSDGAKFHSCGGDVTVLADVVGTEFVWDDPEGTSTNTIVKSSGVYNLKYKDAKGCETGFAVEIIPTIIEDNTVASDNTLCEGESITLVSDLTAGTGSPDVVWKKDDTEVGTGASLVLKKVTSDNQGEYTYEAELNGCKKSGTFGKVEVLPRPTYTLKEVNPLCAGDQLEIGLATLDPSTANVDWTPNPTLVSTGNTAVVTPLNNETYSFTISQNGGCKIVENISVKVVQPIDFAINGKDTIVCANNIGILRYGLKIAEGDVLSYEWKDTDKDSVVSSTSVMKFNEKVVGTYKYEVTLTSEACRPVHDNIEVTVAGSPLVDTVVRVDYHNVEIVPNTSYGEAPYEYKVDVEDFTTTEIAYVKYGHHVVVIKDNNGCISEYEFETEAPDFEIPTVITPNGDGKNDAFISQVISEAYPDARVTIYDRFGKKLTEIKGDESWDGMYMGHKMPSTDYWYEIWIEEIRKKYVGHFTLVNE